MIAFYHNLTNCFITAEKDPALARRSVLLLSSKTLVYSFRATTAQNFHELGSEVNWPDWTLGDSSRFQNQNMYVGQKTRHTIQMDIFFDTHDVDRIVLSKISDHSRMLALKVKGVLESILHWTGFMEILRPGSAADFVEHNLAVRFETPHEKERRCFINECERNLYLSQSAAEMHKENFRLVQHHKKLDEYLAYINTTPKTRVTNEHA